MHSQPLDEEHEKWLNILGKRGSNSLKYILKDELFDLHLTTEIHDYMTVEN
jgi:hypothetical protein